MSDKPTLALDAANLPEGCKHLYGALFTVPFDAIRTPDEDDGELDQNPRMMTERGQSDIIDKKLSADLRENIKARTLLNPLVCRWIEEDGKYYPMVLGGDRRYRALDFLRRKKELVTDPRNVKLNNKGQWEYATAPADEAYALVPCQIFACNTDLEARSLAWAENKNRINLTEGHEVAEVIALRKHKASDEQILEILQQDEKWLKETDALVATLDENTLADLLESRMDRASAMELAQIADKGLREKIRVKANEVAQETCNRKIKRLQKQVETAIDQREIAEGAVADAEFHHDDGAVAEAQGQVTEAEAKIKRTMNERDNSTPVTTQKNIREAKHDAGVDDRPLRILRAPQIKEGLDYIDMLIAANGVCPEGSFTCPLDALKLVRAVLNNNIMANESDFSVTIKRHADKATRKAT